MHAALSHEEHQLWLELCKKLKETGAVTQADCDSPVARNDTPGQQLFNLIRSWGDLRERMGRNT